MDPVPVPDEPHSAVAVLYGALVVGALLALVATGWVLSVALPRSSSARSPRRPPSVPSHRARRAGPAERARARARCCDAESGAPLRGASVWAGPAEIRTDDEGRFTTDPLQAGRRVPRQGAGLRASPRSRPTRTR